MCPPVVMVSRVDAQDPIHTTHCPANRSTNDSANRTRGSTAPRCALVHPSKNALSVNRRRGCKQSGERSEP
jgi:hypothetical protein